MSNSITNIISSAMTNHPTPMRYIVYNNKKVFQASYATDPFGDESAFAWAKMTCKQMGGEVVAVFPHDPYSEIHIFKHKVKRPLKK